MSEKETRETFANVRTFNTSLMKNCKYEKEVHID
jgi:hypothetical protein